MDAVTRSARANAPLDDESAERTPLALSATQRSSDISGTDDEDPARTLRRTASEAPGDGVEKDEDARALRLDREKSEDVERAVASHPAEPVPVETPLQEEEPSQALAMRDIDGVSATSQGLAASDATFSPFVADSVSAVVEPNVTSPGTPSVVIDQVDVLIHEPESRVREESRSSFGGRRRLDAKYLRRL